MSGAGSAEAARSADEIEREVLARISPSDELHNRVREVCDRLVASAEAAAHETGTPLTRCLVAGSAARGTYLADRLDLDLFLLFPPTTSRADLERGGLAIGARVLSSTETRYAEHPYLRGLFEEFHVDAVPGFAVEDPAHPLSAVDRTPFHQAYLVERLTPGLAGEVRLAKQYLRSLGIYGSEARTGGFSGYLIELLVLRFGGLRPLLHAARGWRIPVRIESTPGARPTVPEDVALMLDDPVDPGRNVSSALTRRNLATFILSAGHYLDRPTPSAFELRSPPLLTRSRALERTADRATHVSVLSLPRPSVVDDILYPQMRKAERAVADEADRLGFRVLGTASAAGPDRVLVLVEVEHPTLPTVRVQEGPPAGIDRVGSFLAKWTAPDAPVLQGPYVAGDGRLAVEARRTERRLEPIIASAFPRLPLGRDLKPAEPGLVRVEPLSEVSESEALNAALTDLLDKRLPWATVED